MLNLLQVTYGGFAARLYEMGGSESAPYRLRAAAQGYEVLFVGRSGMPYRVDYRRADNEPYEVGGLSRAIGGGDASLTAQVAAKLSALAPGDFVLYDVAFDTQLQASRDAETWLTNQHESMQVLATVAAVTREVLGYTQRAAFCGITFEGIRPGGRAGRTEVYRHYMAQAAPVGYEQYHLGNYTYLLDGTRLRTLLAN